MQGSKPLNGRKKEDADRLWNLSEEFTGVSGKIVGPTQMKFGMKLLKLWETKVIKKLPQQLKPKFHRAVANACGKNPFPIEIPCHHSTNGELVLFCKMWTKSKKEFFFQKNSDTLF